MVGPDALERKITNNWQLFKSHSEDYVRHGEVIQYSENCHVRLRGSGAGGGGRGAIVPPQCTHWGGAIAPPKMTDGTKIGKSLA